MKIEKKCLNIKSGKIKERKNRRKKGRGDKNERNRKKSVTDRKEETKKGMEIKKERLCDKTLKMKDPGNLQKHTSDENLSAQAPKRGDKNKKVLNANKENNDNSASQKFRQKE